jgi:hypothetical protein
VSLILILLSVTDAMTDASTVTKQEVTKTSEVVTVTSSGLTITNHPNVSVKYDEIKSKPLNSAGALMSSTTAPPDTCRLTNHRYVK